MFHNDRSCFLPVPFLFTRHTANVYERSKTAVLIALLPTAHDEVGAFRNIFFVDVNTHAYSP